MERKRFFVVLTSVLCVALVAFLAFSCKKKGGSASGDDSLRKVKEKNLFTIGLDDSFPPMGYRNESNEIVGFDVELAAEAAKRMGVKFKAQSIDWNAKEMELSTGNIDCIWNGFTMTDERKKQLLFSEPYLDNEQVLLVVKGGAVKSDADISGKRVGVQAGSSGAEAFEASDMYSKAKVTEYKDFLTAIMDLKVGGIDAVVIDSIVAGAELSGSGSDNLDVIRTDKIAVEKYGVGFRKGDVALRNEVQKHLDAMFKDGTAAKIAEKYGVLI